MRIIYQLIAVMMIFLILGMPVSAVSGIVSYDIKGKDGVSKTVAYRDTLNIEAVIAVEGDAEITPDQVWMGNSIPFDSCIQDINGYRCDLEFPKGSQPMVFSKDYPFTINLHNDSHSTPPISYTIIDSKMGYLALDLYPPRVEVDLDKTKSDGTIEVSFDAFDDSYEIGKYNYCSGIKTVEFATDDGKISAIFDYEANECSASDSFEVDTTELEERPYTLLIDTVDYMGHTARFTKSFEVDRTGAVFSNLRVLDHNGFEITHIGTAFIDAIIKVDVNDDVNLDTVRADISSLTDRPNYFDRQGECYSFDNQITCEWRVRVVVSAYGAKTLTFRGEDNIGNVNEQVFTKLISQDTEGPIGQSLKSNLVGSDGVSYVTPGNNIIEVAFTEAGSGLNETQVLLDLSSLGGQSDLMATRCEPSWRCLWEGLNFTGTDGTYSISLNSKTKDKLGNKLKEPFSGSVVLDTSGPKIINIEVNTVGGANAYEDITTFGDSLEVVASVYEVGTLSEVYADFSSFISEADKVYADQCQKLEDNIYECRWFTEAIDITGYINEGIVLNFKDFIGNSASFEKQFTAYGISTSYEDYWTHSVECSPASVDREVTSLIDQRIYCHVKLHGNAEVLSMSMEDCSKDDSGKYLKTEELLNSQRGTTDPYIKLVLNAADIEEDSLKITCPLIILSKAGNKITSVPEIEEISIDIPFYNLPLGEYGKNMEGKIDDAIEDATGTLWKLVTALNKIVFYAERICSLITTINNIASILNVVGSYQRIMGEVLSTNPVTAAPGAALQASGRQQQSITSVLNSKMKTQFLGQADGKSGFINKFCKFISCRLFYDEMFGEEATGEQSDTITGSLGQWQRSVLGFANDVSTGGGVEFLGLGGQGINAYTTESGKDERGGVSGNVLLQGGKLNPKDSIVLSFATLCIPGIVYHLDKYRQIKCMYADCLQTSVDTGIPVAACEDAKEQETCKYIYGEVFQLLPFTGLLDYYIGLIKGVLYSPFGVIDLVMGYVCMQPITTPFAGSAAKWCLFQEMAGMIADVWSDLSNIKDSWKIQNDYCARVKEPDDGEDGKKKSSSGGLFS